MVNCRTVTVRFITELGLLRVLTPFCFNCATITEKRQRADGLQVSTDMQSNSGKEKIAALGSMNGGLRAECLELID